MFTKRLVDSVVRQRVDVVTPSCVVRGIYPDIYQEKRVSVNPYGGSGEPQ